MAVSAWEAYIEEIVTEAVMAIRPPAANVSWSVHFASVVGQTRRFHNPNPDNVKAIFADAIGIADIHATWNLPNQTPVQCVQDLWRTMNLRHQIAHVANPRPVVSRQYAS